jgi:hypothetical protein
LTLLVYAIFVHLVSLSLGLAISFLQVFACFLGCIMILGYLPTENILNLYLSSPLLALNQK